MSPRPSPSVSNRVYRANRYAEPLGKVRPHTIIRRVAPDLAHSIVIQLGKWIKRARKVRHSSVNPFVSVVFRARGPAKILSPIVVADTVAVGGLMLGAGRRANKCPQNKPAYNDLALVAAAAEGRGQVPAAPDAKLYDFADASVRTRANAADAPKAGNFVIGKVANDAPLFRAIIDGSHDRSPKRLWSGSALSAPTLRRPAYFTSSNQEHPQVASDLVTFDKLTGFVG